jgi:peptidoglycan/LPS O-acetylase OafA/YrhL
MPELDVLRGVAILAVLCYHGLYWSGATSANRLLQLIFNATVAGWLGVNLFFVLSGFLITGILLDSKGKSSYYRKFYLRRALRILPAYLALIFFLLLIGWLNLKSTIPILLFIANYSFPFHLASYGPFWSLSVEEQFYLFWPMLVALVSRRTFTIVSIALCFIEPFLRWLSASGHLPLGNTFFATYLIADNLALGALAAIFARSAYGTLRNGIRLGAGLCLAGLIVLAVGLPHGIMHRTNVIGSSFQIVPWNLIFTGLLLLLLGLRSPLASGRWTAPLRFFGNISYGLYLVHFLIFVRYDDYRPLLHNASLRHLLGNSLVRFSIAGGFSILIAWLSRTFYEERFLRMGRSTRPALALSPTDLPAIQHRASSSATVKSSST